MGEINLRSAINTIYNNVDWNWYRQNGQNVLYWNWSPDYNFAINVKVQGWCEAMITYILAASSPNDTAAIPTIVYTQWLGAERRRKEWQCLLWHHPSARPSIWRPAFLRALFFPRHQSKRTVRCLCQLLDTGYRPRHDQLSILRQQPRPFQRLWQLLLGTYRQRRTEWLFRTCSPTNDDGVISPTAAISSLPYTPTQSMNALRFFYYKLGNKIWGQYGFIDAFNLTNIWFDNDYLAIDQGPEIVMIENYRSGLFGICL